MFKDGIFLHTLSLQWILKAQKVVRNYENYMERSFNVNEKYYINIEQ